MKNVPTPRHEIDGDRLLWKGKPLALADGAQGADLRVLADNFATDGQRLYFRHKALPLPAACNVARLELRTLERAYATVPLFTVHDGAAVWVCMPRGSAWCRLEGARLDRLERVHAHDHGLLQDDHTHLRDTRAVWYLDSRHGGIDAAMAVQLDGADPPTVRLLGARLAVDGVGETVWHRGQPLEGWRASQLTLVVIDDGDWLRSDDALLRVKDDVTVVATCKPPRAAKVVVDEAMQALAADLFSVFETLPDVEQSPNGVDLERRALHPPRFSASLDASLDADGQLVLRPERGDAVAGAAQGWYGLLCRVWLASRGEPGRLRLHSWGGTLLPEGSGLHTRILRRHEPLVLELARALHDAGTVDDARVLMHMTFAHFRRHAELAPSGPPPVQARRQALLEPLAGLPRPLAAEWRCDFRHDGWTQSTNLAVARRVLADGLLDDADVRVRLEGVGLLHKALSATSKQDRFFGEVVPAVIARRGREPSAMVVEMIDMVVECAVERGVREIELGQGARPVALASWIGLLIEHGVNVARQRERLRGLGSAEDQLS